MYGKGSRAILLVLLIIVLSFILAWHLRDGSIWTTSTSLGMIGKFLYDGARDVAEIRAAPNAPS